MPAVTRKGDLCTGHGCFPSRVSTGGSSNVFVNGIPVHRQGDGWSPHGCSVCPPHGGNLAAGSATVFANGLQLGRIGDPVDCGSAVAEGSGDVFAGGQGFRRAVRPSCDGSTCTLAIVADVRLRASEGVAAPVHALLV